jgi:hypothetical protein
MRTHSRRVGFVGSPRIAAGVALAFLCFQCAWAEDAASKAGPKQSADDEVSRWYVLVGSVNNQPRLDDAARQIDREINRTFKLLAPGFDDVKTFEDQRDDFLIWTPYVGVGRVLSKRWDVFFQAGYAEGDIRTRQTNLTRILVPLHTDIEFHRSSFFIGPGVAFYPMGVIEHETRDSIKDRLKSAKPFAAATFNYNYLGFDAEVKAGLPGLGSLMKQKQKERWEIWSTGATLGMDIPLTKRSSLSLNGQYNFFLDHGDDFSGPAFNIYWKRFF